MYYYNPQVSIRDIVFIDIQQYNGLIDKINSKIST